MEDPVAEIPQIIRLLTQTPPSIQRQTLERYFTPSASFTHPFCRTGSFNGSRWLIWCIYRWYKILSPHIDIEVESVAFDKHSLLLYVSIYQVFRIWLIPGYSAPVSLVTVLKLVPASRAPFSHTQAPPTRERYLIQSQNDLYQVNEFIKFFSVFRLTWLFVLGWQFIVTVTCVVGAMVGAPLSWIEENVIGGNKERALKDVVMG